MLKNPESFKEYKSGLLRAAENGYGKEILISMGTCGIAAGTEPILSEIKKEIKKRGLEKKVKIIPTGCMGLCHSEPSLEIVDKTAERGRIFGNVTVKQISSLIDLLATGKAGETELEEIDRGWFYPDKEKADRLQARIVLRNCGRIDPENIDAYIAAGGYQALVDVLSKMKPTEVVEIISESGLRGRGGGGFPTGRKWSIAAGVEAERKYIICNADEGDPGAFMDRAVLEGDPHAVLEAMALAGYAVGADRGIIYIRAEYPLAVKRLQKAITQAKEKGLTGNNILGSGFNFLIDLCYGAGAFVCGEETALINSIGGKRGTPSFKPPFPAVSGLYGKPTIVNNVETLANIPAIIRHGASWFRKIGTESCPGTKVFALAGKINKVGLIEVPMSIKLRDIIFTIGEGIQGGKEFKAVQTGGPSGGCLTKRDIDTSIDYESLKALGSMMGSGGMIVMDEDDCMVNIARFFLDFTKDESCGKCTPCRLGGIQMYNILDRITKGEGEPRDLESLEVLSEAMKGASLCALGQTAPNPVLSTLRLFREEYEQHIADKKCPARHCSELISYCIDAEACTGCTLCTKKCPVSCITGNVKEPHVIDRNNCIKCGVCFDVCKFNAVIKQ